MDPLANILAPVMTAEQRKSQRFVMLEKQNFIVSRFFREKIHYDTRKF
jgi:hypothetical protein